MPKLEHGLIYVGELPTSIRLRLMIPTASVGLLRPRTPSSRSFEREGAPDAAGRSRERPWKRRTRNLPAGCRLIAPTACGRTRAVG